MSDNADFIQPQQQGLTGSTVVTQGDTKTANPNKQLLQPGVNPGRIIQVVDLGTHMESYQNNPEEPKRKIRVAFEHSHLKQKYYIEDDVVKPAMTSKEVTYIFSSKSWIKSLLDIVEGRNVSVDEAKSYDLSKLLGRVIGVNILHQQTVAKTHFYEKIASISTWNDQMMKMPDNWAPEADMHFFFIDMTPAGEVIGQNFTSQVFANLPWGVRAQIMKSQEAIAYKAKGGKFADKKENENQSQAPVQQQAPQQQIQQAPASAPTSNMPTSPDGLSVLQMIDKDNSYESYVAVGWNANQLVAQRHAQWVPVAPKTMQTPPPPSGPPAPATQQQQPQPQQGFQQSGGEDDVPF